MLIVEGLIEGVDFVVCPICLKSMRSISHTHLKKHSLKFKEFLEKYPNCLRSCKKTKERMFNRPLGNPSKKVNRACACGCGEFFECVKSSPKKYLNRSHVIHKKHSSETRFKISAGQLGNKRPFTKNTGKLRAERKLVTCLCGCGEQFYCTVKKHRKYLNTEHFSKREIPDSFRELISSLNKGKKVSIETRVKRSNSLKGRTFSEDTKKKMRISAINKIKNKGKTLCVSYNKKEVEYFRRYDVENNTKGICAPVQHHIESLGYFPDYINFDLKIIIEFDEKAHYDVFGNLKIKDVVRQKEIQNLFPDFKFIRVKEWEAFNA